MKQYEGVLQHSNDEPYLKRLVAVNGSLKVDVALLFARATTIAILCYANALSATIATKCLRVWHCSEGKQHDA